MKKLILTSFFLVCLAPVMSQGWKKTYLTGTGEQISLSDVKSVPAGGSIACGFSGTSGNQRAVLLRCNDQGDVIWAKEYNNARSVSARKVALTPDGGYVVWISEKDTATMNDQNLIIKTDTSGLIAWEYGFDGSTVFDVGDITVSPSGKTYMTGVTEICQSSFGCGFVAALSPSGNFLWATSIEGNFLTNLYDIIWTSDDHLLMAGFVLDSITFVQSGFIAKADSNGALVWANNFAGGITSDVFYAITENAASQGYVMAGSLLTSIVDETDMLVVACDYAGSFQAGGSAGGPEADALEQIFTLNGSDLFLGGYASVGSGVNVYNQGLNLQLDISNGNLSNGSLLGVTGQFENVAAADQTSAGQLVQVTRRSTFSAVGYTDYLLSKSITAGTVCNETSTPFTASTLVYTDNFGGSATSVTFTPGGLPLSTGTLPVVATDGCINIGMQEAPAIRMSLFPNPAKDFLLINADLPVGATVRITDTKGSELLRRPLTGSRTCIDVRGLPTGTYVVHLISGTHATQQKLVIRQ